MRIASIKVENLPPVQRFEVTDLSDLVVIAGPNGVGKTRLITHLLNAFRGSAGGVEMFIEATSKEEIGTFGAKQLSTSGSGLQRIMHLVQTNKLRRNYRSGVLYFESGRSIQNIQPLPFAFDFADPYMENVSWDLPMQGLAGRWQDTQHAIFKKIQSQKTSIANKAIDLRNQGFESMNLQFSDPLEPFKEAFAKLLGPKKLTRADLSAQQLMYEEDGEERSINTLSSGEREVLNVTFDFILRNPNDCIIFFDEPEVHLHPELLIRMVATLRSIGRNNQFFFLSHSPDLVSSSLEDSVVFLTPRKADGSNQAILVKPGDETTEAMHQLGHSVGVLSLGRKIVIIEGTDASLDKRTYSQILANRFPDLVLVPGGGRRTVENFAHLVSTVLDKAVWGVEFFMLTDRDAGPIDASSGKIAQLPRYHLENYFLDSEVLAACFDTIEDDASWLRDPATVEKALCDMAVEKVGYAVALKVAHTFRQLCGNVSIMPSGAHGLNKQDLIDAIAHKAEAERIRNASALELAAIREATAKTYDEFLASINDGTGNWKIDVPGKPILKTFCHRADIPVGRLKNLYLKVVEEKGMETFADLVTIFARFAGAAEGVATQGQLGTGAMDGVEPVE
jgi:energy-coupling factor transporter ATP-binding protein EcfA2